MSAAIDLNGQRFGRLTVLGVASARRGNKLCWDVRCDCGVEKVVASRLLRDGRARSCGCLRRELTGRQFRVHGGKDTSEYNSWRGMRARCRDPKNRFYKLYGGRGVTVCEAWDRSFSVFLADMGPKPSPNHSIDRIDVDGNYEPSNCRWATPTEQQANKRPRNGARA